MHNQAYWIAVLVVVGMAVHGCGQRPDKPTQIGVDAAGNWIVTGAQLLDAERGE